MKWQTSQDSGSNTRRLEALSRQECSLQTLQEIYHVEEVNAGHATQLRKAKLKTAEQGVSFTKHHAKCATQTQKMPPAGSAHRKGTVTPPPLAGGTPWPISPLTPR